ncbi:hypothetical protein GCM10012320_34370 [Sinomonas cellulolyticus]|uniref:Uncharacterized protein n=1 Tax=Sinomonas cellulolyticus TaxID=2801916 RepID=A0ABS1K7T6_9MICC|nr:MULTISPECIES: hypothetical protein [Sinomonas]MBL0706962.1 hypothetical protein [Sinomonas cellulolyticus]GHG59979.1 hypothetical protein GCM10012320_34370 [Sinomonas sp. KCTC 49339]
MASYLDIARAFYRQRPQLLEGMPDGPEALACILARQLAEDLKGNGPEYRAGLTADLPPQASEGITPGAVGAAFRRCSSTTVDRLRLLRDEIQAMLESQAGFPPGLSPERIREAEAHLRNGERRDLAAVRKMSLTLSQATASYWNSVLDYAGLHADGPAPDLAALAAEAREAEQGAAAEAGAGLSEVLAFAPLVDDEYTFASDHDPDRRRRAGQRRSLLDWRPEDLARHYPPATDLGARRHEIAARAAYPFGLKDRESIATMAAAVLLVHGIAPGADIRGRAADVRQRAEGNPMAAAALAPARHRESTTAFSGLDFLRILGGALAAEGEEHAPETGAGWPPGVLKELLRGGAQTDEGPRLLAEAVPLAETPDWTDNDWESIGRRIEEIIHRDLQAQRGGTPAPRDGEEADGGTPMDDGPGPFSLPHAEHARTSIRMRSLHEFRNVLVNTETGKAGPGTPQEPDDVQDTDLEPEPRAFRRMSLLSTNAFLGGGQLQHQASAELGRFRKINDRVLTRIRTEHHSLTRPGAAIPSGCGRAYYEDTAPDRLTEALHDQSRTAMLRAGLEPGTPLEDIPDLDLIPGAVLANRHLAGTESPEKVKEDGSPLWLTALRSDTVRRRLGALSTASEDASYTPVTEAARTVCPVPPNGRRLREAAQTISAFSANPGATAAKAATLQRALADYAKRVWKDDPARTEACLHLAAGLILDAYTEQEG